MEDIRQTFSFEVPAEEVFSALTLQNNFEKWWTVDCSVEPKVGGKARFDFNPFSEWAEFEIDLSPYGKGPVTIELENRPNDWRNEWAYWHEVKIVK